MGCILFCDSDEDGNEDGAENGDDDDDAAQEGELQLERHRCLNKIGHALHYKYRHIISITNNLPITYQ